MFHSYIDEIFNKIPILLEDGTGLQKKLYVTDKITSNMNNTRCSIEDCIKGIQSKVYVES